MTRALPRRWAGGVAAAAALATLLAVGPAPRPAAAEPPALPPGLKKVPADAALFAHVDVAAVWNSKIGETVRAAKARELERALGEVKKRTGLTPDMVKTFTLVYPQLKSPFDFQSPVFYITFNKPYDRAKVVEALKKVAAEDKAELKEAEPGVYDLIADRVDRSGQKVTEPDFTFAFTDLTAVTIAGKGRRGVLKNTPVAADGPLAPAIKAAADGATAVLGVNFAGLPDEIRGDDVPAEVRPFQPLFRSDAMIATGQLDGDTLKLAVRFRNQEKAKTMEAEKSLAAGTTLLQTLLSVGIKELEKSKQEEQKAFLPLAKETVEILRHVKVSADDNEAVATAAVKTDLPFAPLLQQAFGGKGAMTAASERARAQNNLKQIGLALHNYHDVYNGFPPAALVDKKGKPMLSWRVLILPFVEQDALYKEFHLDEPWDSEHNKKVLEKHPMPPVFVLPGVTKEGEKTTHFQVFVGNGALFDPIQTTKIQSVTDGTSNTVMVATAAKAVPWTKPDDIPFDPKAEVKPLLLMQGNGCNIGMADGSVRFVSKSVSEEVLKAVITKAGGEVVGPDF